jgi:acetylornithine/succinyldiaminopimelate/putrescine aminotransferase
VPIGAAVVSEAVGALLKPGTHGSTFGGNFLACAAALAVVQTVNTPMFLSHVRRRSEELRAGLAQLFPNAVVRGRGLLVGVVLDDAPTALVRSCLTQGLVVGSAGGNVLRLAPPLTITADEIEVILQRLEAAQRDL